MKSRITIEVDFETESSPMQPVIQIIYQSSDDVRDKLVKSFLEKFNDSGLCKVEWRIPPQSQSENSQRIILTPISSFGGFPDIENKEQILKFFQTGEVRGSGMECPPQS